MKYEMIDAVEAPAKPSGQLLTQRGRLLRQIVSNLAIGRVARVQLEGTETVRGTKTSLTRVARDAGKQINQWDDGDFVYVELTGWDRHKPA